MFLKFRLFISKLNGSYKKNKRKNTYILIWTIRFNIDGSNEKHDPYVFAKTWEDATCTKRSYKAMKK